MESHRHPRTSEFVKHFLFEHPHLADRLAAHLRDDPEGMHAVVAEWDEAGKDQAPAGDGVPHDLSHTDARRLLALAMVDAEHDAQNGGEPVSDELREAFRSLADEGHLAAVLGLHPEEEFHKAWDSKSHPRDDKGRFIRKDEIEAAKSDPAKAKELLAKTTKPAERAKLEKVLGGEVQPGQSKGDDRKQATREKKEKVQASRTRAAELAAKATKGDATREELAELADHLPALNVKQLRQVRAALYAKLGGVKRRDEILAKVRQHAQDMAGGDTQHARKQDEAAADRKAKREERAAKQKKLRGVIKKYGFINPSDSAFTAFGSMKDAVREYGFNIGMFRKDSKMGFDEIAEAMIRDGHLTQPAELNATDALWQRLTEDADSMFQDRKDEFADAEAEYYKELAAVAAEQGVKYEYGADLTAEDLFGDDEQSATAYRRADELAGQEVAVDPYGAGGERSQDPWDEPVAGTGEQLTGGTGDGKADAEFPPEQLQEGAKVEQEHTDDPDKAKEIAKDHLTEDPKAYTPAAEETKGDVEPVSQKPGISDSGKSPVSGKQPADKPKSVVATKPLVKPKPKDAPREKTEAELEREQRAKIDAKVKEDKAAKKREKDGGDSDKPDDFTPPPEDEKQTLDTLQGPDTSGADPYADDKFHGSVAENFPGDTPEERYAAAWGAKDGKRKAAADDAGMTLAEFDAELNKRIDGKKEKPAVASPKKTAAPTRSMKSPEGAVASAVNAIRADGKYAGTGHTIPLSALRSEVEKHYGQMDDAAFEAAVKAVGKGGAELSQSSGEDATFSHNGEPVSAIKASNDVSHPDAERLPQQRSGLSPDELQAKLRATIGELTGTREGKPHELIPIHQVRAELAKQVPGLGHGEFNDAVLALRKDRQSGHTVTSVDDRSRMTPEQLRDSVHAVGETFAYIDRPEGQKKPSREEELAALMKEQEADDGGSKKKRKKKEKPTEAKKESPADSTPEKSKAVPTLDDTTKKAELKRVTDHIANSHGRGGADSPADPPLSGGKLSPLRSQVAAAVKAEYDRTSGSPSLDTLYEKVATPLGLSPAEFRAGMKQLHDDGVVELTGWNKSPHDLPRPDAAVLLPGNSKIYYRARLTDKTATVPAE